MGCKHGIVAHRCLGFRVSNGLLMFPIALGVYGQQQTTAVYR